jgi:AcrR family transcriptional regulator
MMRCADAAMAGIPYFTEFVEGRRGEILDAALCVFAEKGYESGTMREIAAALGVTEPALYRHYAGKEAILEDLVTVAGDRVVGAVSAVLEALDPAHPREALLELIRTRREHAPTDASVAPVMRLLLTAAPHNPAFRDVFRAHLAMPMVACIAGFIPRVDASRGIQRAPEQVTRSMRLFASLIVGYVMTGMMLEMPSDDEGAVDAVMAIMGWDESADPA